MPVHIPQQGIFLLSFQNITVTKIPFELLAGSNVQCLCQCALIPTISGLFETNESTAVCSLCLSVMTCYELYTHSDLDHAGQEIT